MFKQQNIKSITVLLSSLLLIFIITTFTIGLVPKAYAANCSQAPQNSAEADNYRDACGCKDNNVNSSNCGIVSYLIKFIDALSALVGIVIVIMIAIAGIQYSAARDNPQAVVAARAKIFNAILALVVFIFSFAFLQYIVPGGIFKS